MLRVGWCPADVLCVEAGGRRCSEGQRKATGVSRSLRHKEVVLSEETFSWCTQGETRSRIERCARAGYQGRLGEKPLDRHNEERHCGGEREKETCEHSRQRRRDAGEMGGGRVYNGSPMEEL